MPGIAPGGFSEASGKREVQDYYLCVLTGKMPVTDTKASL